MNELALFAGAGGGILGGHLLGWRTVAAVEIEDYPRRVLLQRQADGILPRFPIWDDICTFDGKPWRGKVDVVSGGFPCQDISCAGAGAGIDGERSGLWSEMLRVVCEVQPRYVFVENSPMLTIRGLGTVLGGLAEARYDAKWCVLGADDVGAPHRRKRIWILAHTRGLRMEKSKLCNSNLFTRSSAPKEGTKMAHSEGQRTGNDCKNHGARRGEIYAPDNTGCPCRGDDRPQDGEAREPDPSWWATEPNVGRVANGVAYRVDRLKAIGNGQVSICAAVAWKILSGMV